MFRALLLLAALGSTPAAAPPVERWEPYGPNPAWEMYGKEDPSGRFIWSQMRIKRPPAPVVNYGVSLPEQSPSGHSLQTSYGANAVGAEVAGELSFTDGPVGRGLAGAIEASNPEAAALGDQAEHLCSADSDECNDGQCPNRKPRPKPMPPELDELSGFIALVKTKQEVAAAVAVGLAALFALIVFLGLLAWACRALFLHLFREKPTPWEPS